MKKLVSIILSCFILFGIVGCASGKDGGKTINVKMWGFPKETEEMILLDKCIVEFEKKNPNIKISFNSKDYTQNTQLLLSQKGPDVIFVNDRHLKRWSNQFLMPLDDYITSYKSATGEDLSEMSKSAMQTYRYNPDNGTQDANAKQWCLPRDISPTALFYNATALKEAGVTIISVDEKDIDAFNKNEKADNAGKKKSDYGFDFDISAKGYIRQNKYYKGDASWVKPNQSENLIFNNRIAMNWDEIEDLSMLMTKDYNDEAPTNWGYFTEWWFNYGWSVGGDCLTDINGNGDWRFSLSDTLPNYIVNSNSFTIANKVYSKGETISFSDKINASASEKITAGDDGKFYSGDKQVTIKQEILDKVISGEIMELPSTKEAFTRFVNLSVTKDGAGDLSKKGLDITPTPSEVGSLGGVGNFLNGSIALLVEQSYRVTNFVKNIGKAFEWDCAPLPVYKEYDYADENNVIKQGKKAGHAGSSGYGIIKDTPKDIADAAFKFIAFMSGKEGQKIFAEDGYTTPMYEGEYDGFNYTDTYVSAWNKSSDVKEGSLRNLSVFVENTQHQMPADWWYMPADDWISIWSHKLNSTSVGVRNGNMSIDEFFKLTVKPTNDRLIEIVNSYRK